MAFSNRVSKMVSKINGLPEFIRSWALSKAVGSIVKMVGYLKIKIESMDFNQVVVSVPNKKRVQNHIGGVHACCTATLAETATGLVIGMNVPDSSLNLLKSMKITYQKRSTGGVKAVATLSDEQIQSVRTVEKGELLVPVVVTDETGEEIVACEMLWAWIPKKR
ncbi:DUF4442 domain-containing protein [Paraneptunicella aestuarii]|uniref:DUF4442 domain-containing protein n=1 Tax=Paraneptunicella aestuarii TaxID=2831148 RepID=UPI001E300071|nr:DUF4442 domain-containing protein [Paraneptunicella aestuarii]UAA37669.1 DUF4442 domain-containing protein [Paraneptunicella aestuarii]